MTPTSAPEFQISPSLVNLFIRYERGELISEKRPDLGHCDSDWLEQEITKTFDVNYWSQRGTALHLLMENPSSFYEAERDKYVVALCDKEGVVEEHGLWEFSPRDVAVALPTAEFLHQRKARFEQPYLWRIPEHDCQVSMRVDVQLDDVVYDFKFVNDFVPDKYRSSLQGEFYLCATGAMLMEYVCYRMPKKGTRIQDAPCYFSVHSYDSMRQLCIDKAGALVEWLRQHPKAAAVRREKSQQTENELESYKLVD